MWPVLLVVATAADPYGFSRGRAPVDLDSRSEAPVWTSSARCAECHPEAAEQWATSRHRVAWTNDLMQAGFVAEPRLFCVYCHAPAAAQVAEVSANLPTYRALSPHAPVHGPPAGSLMPEPHAEEGVSCAVCHLRDGAVLSAYPAAPEAPHPIRTDPAFGTEAACTTCHEFMAPSFVDGTTLHSDQPMQATVSEWRAWQARTGRTEDCTDCHMPAGDHTMSGIHDLGRLRSAIQWDFVQVEEGWVLRLEAVDVGHAVPTGDLFRHLTLEVQRSQEGVWEEVARLGRSFAVDRSGEVPIKREVSDTRLQPGTPIDLPLPSAQVAAVRLRVHLGGAHDERRGLVPLKELVTTVYWWTWLPNSLDGPDRGDSRSTGMWHSEG